MKEQQSTAPADSRAQRRHSTRSADSGERRGSTLAPLFVSVVEAGSALGVGRSKAWELVRSGQLASVRIGHRVLVSVKALDDFAAQLEDRSKSA